MPPNPGYPNQGAPYPPSTGYPAQSPYPHQSPFPSANPGYPHAVPYPNPNPNPGYPVQNSGYPPVQQSSAPFGAGFYPNNPGYPPSHGGSTYPPIPTPSSTDNVYPPALPHMGYPPLSNTNTCYLPSQGYPGPQQPISSGYPSAAASNIASCFAEMQSHIKDTKKSKVCLIFLSWISAEQWEWEWDWTLQ